MHWPSRESAITFLISIFSNNDKSVMHRDIASGHSYCGSAQQV
jgi:hypothetical protein